MSVQFCVLEPALNQVRGQPLNLAAGRLRVPSQSRVRVELDHYDGRISAPLIGALRCSSVRHEQCYRARCCTVQELFCRILQRACYPPEMGRDNYGSVNVPKLLKPRIAAAAKLLKWSETKVAGEAIKYVLDVASAPGARESQCQLIRMLANESWGNQTYGEAAFAAERSVNSRIPALKPDKARSDTEDTDHMLRKAKGASAI